MHNRKALVLLVCVAALGFSALGMQNAGAQQAQPSISDKTVLENFIMPDATPIVYMTTDITPAGLIAVYEALGVKASGNVAVKIHTGEPDGKYFLSPSLIKDLVQKVNGTLVECNTVASPRRASTALHYQVAKDHGFTAIAPVVILDEKSDMTIPVANGKRLKESYIGARFNEFDSHIVLSHFKGHPAAGFGGAIKNMSVGYASAGGKAWIHSGGQMRTNPWIAPPYPEFDQTTFLESMAEAAKAVADVAKGRIVYINVMNNLSVDYDCYPDPAPPTMADIGILASLDPVALDAACVELIYAAKDGKDVVERIESRSGHVALEHAVNMGLGSKNYRMVELQ